MAVGWFAAICVRTHYKHVYMGKMHSKINPEKWASSSNYRNYMHFGRVFVSISFDFLRCLLLLFVLVGLLFGHGIVGHPLLGYNAFALMALWIFD